MTSPKRSWIGFKISKNLKASLKQAAYILIPAVITELVTHNVISSSIAGLVGKIVFSAIEYYYKEIQTG